MFLAVLLILAALPSFAEKKPKERSPYKYEVNVSWGYMPTIGMGYGYYNYPMTESLDKIYGNYSGKSVTTGLISADFNIQFLHWLALGTQLNAAAITTEEMSPISQQKIGSFPSVSVSALAYARFTYLNRKYVKMYASVGLGVGYSYEGAPSTSETYSEVIARGQFIPLGIMAGDKVYGLLEFGGGTEYCGFRLGVGYRF